MPRANMVSQTDPLKGSAASTPGIPEVMVAIATCQMAIAFCRTALTTKIETVQLYMGLIRQDLDKVRSRLSMGEVQVGHIEDTVARPARRPFQAFSS